MTYHFLSVHWRRSNQLNPRSMWRCALKKTAVRFGSIAILISLILISSPAKSAYAQDQTTIMKDTVQVRAFTLNVYKGNYDNWSWIPDIDFRVNGPIPS